MENQRKTAALASTAQFAKSHLSRHTDCAGVPGSDALANAFNPTRTAIKKTPLPQIKKPREQPEFR
jgi:hypothetical protein